MCLKVYFYTLLASFAFTCCNGQVKTSSPKNYVDQQKGSTQNHTRIIRTQGVTSGNVGCELQDSDGNLWFSISGEGIYRYDGKSFTNYTTKNGLCDNDAGKIIQDNAGNILIATATCICKYNGKNFSKFIEIDSITNLMVTSLFEDRDGNIWFGTKNNGIYRYDGIHLTNFLNNDRAFNLGNTYQLIMDILQDKNGNMWFSSWNRGGLWRYDGNEFTNYLPSKSYYKLADEVKNDNDSKLFLNPLQSANSYPSSQDSITDDMIFSMTEDKFGNLWLATRRHGACRYDGKTFTSFREKEGFVSYGIYSILEDEKGNIWFSTDKNGVFRYDGNTFRNYTTADGLIHNSVFSILEDQAGNLWFGTRGFGLSRFDGKNFITFSEY